MSGRWVRESRAASARGGEQAAASATPRLEVPLGQGEQLSGWQRRARQLSMPHAVVVEGARGIGKSTVMQWLAASLLCASELDAHGPCGVCRTCARVASGLHPDLHRLDRATDEDDRKEWKKSFYVIKVDQVRQAQELLARHALEGRARVLLVADADSMEEEAQNALLKTLEEPGAATFLLLEAARPEQLLPTVRSRVQRLRALPLDDATIRRELARRIPEREAHFDGALAVAGGSLGLALAACTERAVQTHDLVLAMLAANNSLRPVAIARAVLEGVAERRLELEAARMFLWFLRAEVRRCCHALAAEAASSYRAGPAEPWTTWLELTLAAERDLDLLIPPEQVLTACLVGFRAR